MPIRGTWKDGLGKTVDAVCLHSIRNDYEWTSNPQAVSSPSRSEPRAHVRTCLLLYVQWSRRHDKSSIPSPSPAQATCIQVTTSGLVRVDESTRAARVSHASCRAHVHLSSATPRTTSRCCVPVVTIDDGVTPRLPTRLATVPCPFLQLTAPLARALVLCTAPRRHPAQRRIGDGSWMRAAHVAISLALVAASSG